MDKREKYITRYNGRLSLRFRAITGNKLAACLLPLILLFGGCVSERIEFEESNATVNISLNIPGYSIKSRAMSSSNESRIDYNNIHVLVFEEVGHEEVFRYKATVMSFEPPDITLKVPVGNAHQRFRFVVVANVEVPHIDNGTPKDVALNHLVFDCVGKWNTANVNPAFIPMWGEYGKLLEIKKNTSINIQVHRALARVDVGVLFKFNNPDPVTGEEYADKETDKESVRGLKNFKIKDIRVYRTVNKAYVTSTADKMVANQVFEPHIPYNAKYNSDSETNYEALDDANRFPLIYTLPTGSDSYIREIYIPESFPSGVNASSANVPCLVIGGYYGEGNNTHVTYYRADFGSYINGNLTDYRSLLRNHRYVFDICKVSGPGFEEPEQALNSIVSEMSLDMKEWNEVPLNNIIQGNYYFSIDSREVILNARPTDGMTVISDIIFYKTNIALDPYSNPFACKWISSGSTFNDNFDIIFDYTEKAIIVKALNENVGIGALPLSDRLEIIVENYLFTIDVKQNVIPAD